MKINLMNLNVNMNRAILFFSGDLDYYKTKSAVFFTALCCSDE
ncbi:unknown [[Mannheimia] succiniciproducens MBEL55E]|uniref:Uncharacterized protein n=1 Tax=Mannheimia succiniciproducens (strain KCTC 0769BP / MBEL55E) TaxID=221988 RepID=Q65WP8_MANSM|nr:unknown [[Mannheimia] succiniciproducens MBEL55E]